ncbi:MAG: DUF3050 domain-containing protein [Verrucomicrobiia bacterium]
MNQSDSLISAIAPLRQKLLHHPLYKELRSLRELQCFMEHHVFAVWDFMSLLKTLQRSLTCVSVPWLPQGDAKARLLINQIVVGEESDIAFDGRAISHFELYLEAMTEAGASTTSIARLISLLREGIEVKDALSVAEISEVAKKFVQDTFVVIIENRIHATAAAFTYGREDLIPSVFTELVMQLDQQHSGKLKILRYYLKRHIELDGDEHGELGREMVCALCGTSELKWQEATNAAIRALESRLRFWDGIYQSIKLVKA